MLSFNREIRRRHTVDRHGDQSTEHSFVRPRAATDAQQTSHQSRPRSSDRRAQSQLTHRLGGGYELQPPDWRSTHRRERRTRGLTTANMQPNWWPVAREMAAQLNSQFPHARRVDIHDLVWQLADPIAQERSWRSLAGSSAVPARATASTGGRHGGATSPPSSPISARARAPPAWSARAASPPSSAPSRRSGAACWRRRRAPPASAPGATRRS